MADFDRELFDALRVAFPDTGELAAFVHLSLGRNLAEIVDERGDLRAQTLGLLRDAKASGDLVRLVLAACRERPRHPRMLALLQHPDIEPFVRGLPTPGEVADLLALIEEAGVKPDPCRRALMAVVDDGASKSSASSATSARWFVRC
jgi:hypothetical protein